MHRRERRGDPVGPAGDNRGSSDVPVQEFFEDQLNQLREFMADPAEPSAWSRSIRT